MRLHALIQVRVRQPEDDVEYAVLARGDDAGAKQDNTVLQDYFNLHMSLADLTATWASQDSRLKDVAPFFPGGLSK